VDEAVQRHVRHLNDRNGELYELQLFAVVLYEGLRPRTSTSANLRALWHAPREALHNWLSSRGTFSLLEAELERRPEWVRHGADRRGRRVAGSHGRRERVHREDRVVAGERVRRQLDRDLRERAAARNEAAVEATQCAAGITAEVRDIDNRVEWDAYCATFLPPGYSKELIGGPNPLEIRIVNATTGARFYFVQGVNMNLSSVTSLVRNEGELVGPVTYGDLEAQLYHSLPGAAHGPFVAVMASGGEEGVIQYIEAYGPSEEEITAVAASMRRLDALP